MSRPARNAGKARHSTNSGFECHLFINNLLIGIFVILIEAPFGHVAVHVVQPPRIRFFQTDLLVGVVGVVEEPPVLFQVEFSGSSPNEYAVVVPCPARVFPFRLGRQTIIVARLRRQPFAIHFGRQLSHADCRKLIAPHIECHIGVWLGRSGDGIRILLVARSSPSSAADGLRTPARTSRVRTDSRSPRLFPIQNGAIFDFHLRPLIVAAVSFGSGTSQHKLASRDWEPYRR